MLTIRLGVDDLASMRFAYSPMQEAAFSLRVFRPGDRDASYRHWLSRTAIGLDDLDSPLLLSLIGPRGWIPDFLTPRPQSARPDLEAELAIIRCTPGDRVLHDFHGSHGDELPAAIAELAGDPDALTRRITAAIAAYWTAVIAPRWPRMSALLEADIIYRSHLIATGGAAALFEGLDPRIRWDDGTIYFDYPLLNADVDVAGRGLPMMPSIFPRGVTAQIDSDQPPILTYPARGRGTLMSEPDAPPDSLAALLGRTRAALLIALAEPTSTTQLARANGLTPSAVSQHLAVLAANGLVSRTRSGHSVLYRRTSLAERLVG